jgi:SAM-dependent methyltransferase
MNLVSPWTDLACSVQRRLSARWRKHPESTSPTTVSEPLPAPDPFAAAVHAYLYQRIRERYVKEDEASKYLANDINHMRRFVTSLKWIPEHAGRVIDPAAGNGLFPALVGHFRNCELEIPNFFNLEKEPAPYPDATFDGVILMEVLEHFTVDPMYAMAEFNRILKPEGFLFLTTPNLASWVSLQNLINHHTPYIYGLFERKPCADRHNREYTWLEVGRLAEAAGFRVEQLEAITVYSAHDVVGPIRGIHPDNRGDTTFLLARKDGSVRDRYPDWLYANWGN